MKIGLAEGDIRTPLGMQMTGYGGRATGAIDAHDQLKMHAVYMASEENKSLLVVCQVLGFDPDFSAETEWQIAKALHIPVANVILHAMHTHAGPASGTLHGCGIATETWLAETREDLIALAKKACQNTFEGTMAYGVGECDIGMNRIARLYKELPYEDMIDKDVGVLRIMASDTGELKGVIVNHACHPVTLGSNNYTYSADYPCYTISKIKEAVGEDVPVIFTLGCCGDIDPKERMSFDAVKSNGEKLGVAALATVTPMAGIDGNIRCASSEMTVDLVPDHDKAGYEQVRDTALAEAKKIIANNYAPHFAHLQAEAVKVVWADRWIRQMEEGSFQTKLHSVIKVWKIGELTIVALPFEVFHELGLDIKEKFGKDKTIVLSCSNGVFGYLPYGDMYDKSRYEAKTSHLYYGRPGPVAKNTGEKLLGFLDKMSTFMG